MTRPLIDSFIHGEQITLENIIRVLEDDSNEEYLFEKADLLRQLFVGDEIHLRAIIEFSNYCRCSCHYCGIQHENHELERFRLSVEEIVNIAKEAYQAGYKTIVLQSGEDLYYDQNKIIQIIQNIKKIGDLAITLSIGERSYADYKRFFEAGADRFLLKHETADEDVYNSLHPHSTFAKRIEALHWLKEIGYQLGSGFMIGLPNQTTTTIAKDLLLLQALQVDMAGIGPFISHPQTQLRNTPLGDSHLTLKVLALARIILKRVHLPTTTSLEVANVRDRANAFYCGANVVMKKVEPYKYQLLYQIYPNSNIKDQSILKERVELEKYVSFIGRTVGLGKGDAIKEELE